MKNLYHKGYESLRANNFLYLNVGVNGFVRALGSVSAFILSMLIGRSMGASEAGVYFFAIAVVMLLSTFARMGTDGTIVRFTGKALTQAGSSDIKSILAKAITLSTALGIIVAVSLYFGSELIASRLLGKPNMAGALQAISPAILTVALLGAVSMSLQGLHRASASIVCLTIATNIALISILLIFEISSAVTLAYIYSGVTGMVFIASLYYWWLKVPTNSGSKLSWNLFLASCLPLWTISILNQASIWSTQLISGAFVEPAELAQLSVALRTATLLSFALGAVIAVISPRFSALYAQEEHKKLEQLVTSSIRLLALISAPLLLCLLIFANPIMALFGEGFSSGEELLKIAAVGQAFGAILAPAGILLAMTGFEKEYRTVIYYFSPIFIIISFGAISICGVKGAAIAASLYACILPFILALRVRKLLNINILSALYRKP